MIGSPPSERWCSTDCIPASAPRGAVAHGAGRCASRLGTSQYRSRGCRKRLSSPRSRGSHGGCAACVTAPAPAERLRLRRTPRQGRPAAPLRSPAATDVVSCTSALGCPTRPVYAGELQCRGLCMAVASSMTPARLVRGSAASCMHGAVPSIRSGSGRIPRERSTAPPTSSAPGGPGTTRLRGPHPT